MGILYNGSIRLFDTAVGLAALFSRKARMLHEGRKNLIPHIQTEMYALRVRSGVRGPLRSIWVHCASLGEFEQGRALIEALRAEYPRNTPRYRPIVVTFFSSSGYEIRKDYPLADAVFYLPADTPAQAESFIEAVEPDMAFFIKYEYWHNYLSALRKRKIPSYLVSAIFRPGTSFFKSTPWGAFMRRTLGLVTHFFVQNEESSELLASIGITRNVTVSGDTRFDRVLELVQSAPELPQIERFVQGGRTMVCGSTWPPDEELLLALMQRRPDIRFIVVPHEIDQQRIANLISRSGRPALRYSEMEQGRAIGVEPTLLVIDTIGLLSTVYRYGELAYVGGGFGRGIHNTLEAVVWGIPVLFGPKYQAFREAVELTEAGAAFPVESAGELIRTAEVLLADPRALVKAGEQGAGYVRRQAGATGRILGFLSGS